MQIKKEKTFLDQILTRNNVIPTTRINGFKNNQKRSGLAIPVSVRKENKINYLLENTKLKLNKEYNKTAVILNCCFVILFFC